MSAAPPRRWTFEDLLARAGNRGAAEAAARFYGDQSARQALTEYDRAVSGLQAALAADGGARGD